MVLWQKSWKKLSQETKKFLENFLSLSLLRGFDRISPLIVLPFLTRTIGLELVGILSITKALCYYFTIFTNYGFPYSATRAIALKRTSITEINKIFSAVFWLKAACLVLCAGALYGLTIVSVTYANIAQAIWLYFIVISLTTFFPAWLFQGLEEMKFITCINVGFKMCLLMWMFFYVRSPSDFYTYLKALVLSEFLRVSFAFFFIHIKWRVRLLKPCLSIMKAQLKEGFHIFLSNLSINSYARLPALVIAPYWGPAAVGAYVVGSRIIRSMSGLVEPLIQAFFPFVSRKISEEQKMGIDMAFTFLKWTSTFTLSLGCILLIFAKPIITFYAGSLIPEAVLILKTLAFMPWIIIVSNILGIEVLININRGHNYSSVMWITALICTGLLFMLVPAFGALGAAISVFAAECFAALGMVFFTLQFLKKQKKAAC